LYVCNFVFDVYNWYYECMSQDLEHNLNRTIFAAVSSYIFVSYAQPDDGS